MLWNDLWRRREMLIATLRCETTQRTTLLVITYLSCDICKRCVAE
jgi:hypothetical protein